MMGLKLEDIRELIQLVDESNFEEVEIEHEGTKVVLKKVADRAAPALPAVSLPPVTQAVASQPAPSVEPVPQQASKTETTTPVEEDPTLHKIVAPMVGTFYRAPSPDADPYVKEGDQVDESTVVCIVEAMKLMNEIEAEVKGTITKVLVENGQLVEYGQPLFLVKTT